MSNMNKLLIGLLLLLAITGLSGAVMLTGTQSVPLAKVTFASNIRFSHDFQFRSSDGEMVIQ